MPMATRPAITWLKRKIVPLATGICIVGAVAFGHAFHNPEAVISASFGRVVSSFDLDGGSSWRADPRQELWANIKPAVAIEGAPLMNLLVVGDHIMLTQPDQTKSSFQILRVDILNGGPSAGPTHIDTSLGQPLRYLITARDSADKSRPVIQFTLEVNVPAEPVHASPRDQIL